MTLAAPILQEEMDRFNASPHLLPILFVCVLNQLVCITAV